MTPTDYPPAVVQLPRRVGIGLRIPERRADCSGVRPSWYPLQCNVCDVDDLDPLPLTPRQMVVPPPNTKPYGPCSPI